MNARVRYVPPGQGTVDDPESDDGSTMSAVGKFTWKILGVTSGILAAKVSRSVAEKVWVKTKGGDPPRNPTSWETTWGEAIGWAVATGVAAGVARLLASRGAAGAWRRTTGHLPPGLEEVGN